MMTTRREMTNHLTDTEFSELMLGSATEEIRAHAAECSMCAEEAEQFSGAVRSFERESRIWAQRHAATMPATVRRPALMPGWAAAWTTAAAIAALGLGMATTHAREQATITQQQQVATLSDEAPVVSPARLEADNALLVAIDGELRADDAPPASAYGLDAPERPGHARGTKRISD